MDWSARSAPSPPRPSPDSVWLAECGAGGPGAPDRVQTRYLRTRHDCELLLRQRLTEHADRGRRVLVGFDFPFGYPRGFAAALGLAGGGPPPGGAGAPRQRPAPWRLVWDELGRLIEDGPDNRNNRFEVAAALNRRCGPRAAPGPLWGCPRRLAGPWIQPTSPRYPFPAGGRSLERLRWAERQVRGTQPAWKLMGIGSAGSQCLLGIPAVSRLRSDPRLRDVCRVWPFETSFTRSPGPADGPFILLAEVWPGILRSAGRRPGRDSVVQRPSMIKDEAQVRAVVTWLRRADSSGGLARLCGSPPGLPASAQPVVLAEEGWILGG